MAHVLALDTRTWLAHVLALDTWTWSREDVPGLELIDKDMDLLSREYVTSWLNIWFVKILIPTSCSFSEVYLQRTPRLSVLGMERWVSDQEILTRCARVRTKCAEKTCVGFWGHSWGPKELSGVNKFDHGGGTLHKSQVIYHLNYPIHVPFHFAIKHTFSDTLFEGFIHI
jgi:hypothetical protein